MPQSLNWKESYNRTKEEDMPKSATPETAVETPAAEPVKTPRKGKTPGRLTTGRTACTLIRRLTEAQLAAIRLRMSANSTKTERDCWVSLATAAIDKLCNELEAEGSKLLATQRQKAIDDKVAQLQSELQALRDERKALPGAP